jgi:hypothetical protein
MLHAYVGIAVKPPPQFEQTSDVGRFVAAACTVDYVRRIATKPLLDAFQAWKRHTDDPGYMLCANEKRRVENMLAKSFFPSSVFTGSETQHGFFGLSLKTDKQDTLDTVGLKLNPKLKKRVLAVDVSTNKVVHVFESLNACATFFETVASNVCMDIRYSRIRKGCFLLYAQDASYAVGSHMPMVQGSLHTATTRQMLPPGINYTTRQDGCKLRAQIRYQGVQHCLGLYEEVDKAVAAYQAAKQAIAVEKNGGPKANFVTIKEHHQVVFKGEPDHATLIQS